MWGSSSRHQTADAHCHSRALHSFFRARGIPTLPAGYTPSPPFTTSCLPFSPYPPAVSGQSPDLGPAHAERKLQRQCGAAPVRRARGMRRIPTRRNRMVRSGLGPAGYPCRDTHCHSRALLVAVVVLLIVSNPARGPDRPSGFCLDRVTSYRAFVAPAPSSPPLPMSLSAHATHTAWRRTGGDHGSGRSRLPHTGGECPFARTRRLVNKPVALDSVATSRHVRDDTRGRATTAHKKKRGNGPPGLAP